MKHNSGGAFRRSLEDRLKTKAIESGTSLDRLRKMVAFDRFLARLAVIAGDSWLLKGGFALQLRMGDRARTTTDIDLLTRVPPEQIRASLQQAGTLDLGDCFDFTVEAGSTIPPANAGGTRYPVRSLLDGRTFEQFHVDVGVGDPVAVPFELLETPALLEFAGIPPTRIPCYPVAQQIAEKVHAYTQRYRSGSSSRVKDLVDILLMATMTEISVQDLNDALDATFTARIDHELPAAMPSPPSSYTSPFVRMARDVELGYATLDSAVEALKRFLDPVLSRQAIGDWNPDSWSWG